MISRTLISAVFSLCLLSSASLQAEERKPNIIYILADDLGYGELGCYGQTKIKTPNLDRMASEGMRFTQHYAGAAVCAPSRFTLLTGRHIGGSRKYGQNQSLSDNTLTLHTLVKKAGYATAAIGKWSLGKNPNEQGVDEWYGFLDQSYAHFHYPERIWKNETHLDLPGNSHTNGLRLNGRYTEKIKDGSYIHDAFTAEALAFIDANKEQPFFLYLPYTIPHLELVVPEDSVAEYRGKFEESPFVTAKVPEDAARVSGGTAFYDGRGYCSTDEPRATYAAMITRMDRDIGQILTRLKTLGLDENTLVIFSSDNGPANFSSGGCDSAFFESGGPLRGGKGSYYEGGLRVPMIARWLHKIPAGAVSDHVSYFPDILPTFADFVGVEFSEHTDGISMMPTLLKEGSQKDHDFLFWAKAVRMGKWKYVYTRKGMAFRRGDGQLFNLDVDLAEEHDVAGQYPEVVEKMQAIIVAQQIQPK